MCTVSHTVYTPWYKDAHRNGECQVQGSGYPGGGGRKGGGLAGKGLGTLVTSDVLSWVVDTVLVIPHP